MLLFLGFLSFSIGTLHYAPLVCSTFTVRPATTPVRRLIAQVARGNRTVAAACALALPEGRVAKGKYVPPAIQPLP